MVYVSCVVPFGAVTSTVMMVVEPTFKEIAPEADPFETELPFTVMVELA